MVLFVYADSWGCFYHLGASYIQAYLKRRGLHSQQFIHLGKTNPEGLVEQILAIGAGIIGFTCYDKNYYISRLIAQRLKHHHPELTIIFGGPTPSFLDRLIMRDCPAIDICVRGEGEHTVCELLQQLPARDGLKHIHGITFRDGEHLLRTPQRLPTSSLNQADTLDIFPSPYLTGVVPPEFITDMGITSGRGCPYHCTYCNSSLSSSKSIRYHSPQRIITELKQIEGVLSARLGKGQKKRLAINDDIFSMDVTRAKHICRLITKQNFSHLEFWAETRADRVDKELLQLLYAAGFREINFGLESAVPRVLRVVKKVSCQVGDFQPERDFIAKLKQRVRQAQRIGLDPTLSIISGLPSETLAEARHTIELVKELKVSTYFHNRLQIYAGTELFRTHPRYGIRVRKSATTLPFNCQLAYDVNRVPVIDERQTSFKYGALMEEANAQQVLRLWGMNDEHQFLLKDILIMEHSVLDAEVIDWLTRYAHLSSGLCIWSRQDEGFDYQQSINRMVARQAPISEINCLVHLPIPHYPSQAADIQRVSNPRYVWAAGLSSDGFYPPHLHSFYFIPLKNFDRLGEGMLKLPIAKGVFLFSLDEMDDMAKFEQLIEQLQAGLAGLPPTLVDHRTGVIDECRWSANECPAASLLKLVIKGRGISPCINGQAIGEIRDGVPLIRDRLTAMRGKVEQERGCGHCPVRDDCSRCLFPYPLSDTDYCDFRRKHPQLGEVMRFLAYLRKVFLYRHLPASVFADLFSHPHSSATAELERFIQAYNLYCQGDKTKC